MIDLRDFGYSGSTEAQPDGLIPARVTEVRRGRYGVVCERGEARAVIKGSFLHGASERADLPAVGDFVLIQFNECGDSAIARLLPRKTKFSRTDFSGHAVGYVKTILEQVVAANFDYVFILTSLNQDFNVNRVLRYLAQARESGAVPVVVLTKADLCGDPELHMRAVRAAADVPLHAVSAKTGTGLPALREYLAPRKTAVFLGMSGVGKSSLLNVLAGEALMDVSEIREDDARGRHTTTHRQLFRLPCGALVIDTPGMRELGLWDAESGIADAYRDVEELIARCRFSDCRHETEPGCAVKVALSDGTLAPARWESYRAQAREAAFVRRKSRR
jgi:ribosome biogenesis GTPase